MRSKLKFAVARGHSPDAAALMNTGGSVRLVGAGNFHPGLTALIAEGNESGSTGARPL